jgi:hypothetical protein
MRGLLLTVAVGLTMCCARDLHAQLVISDEPMGIAVQKEPVDTLDPIYRAFVTVGTNKFTFIIPQSYRSGGDPEHGRFQLKTIGGNSLITINFITTESSDFFAGPDAYRD